MWDDHRDPQHSREKKPYRLNICRSLSLLPSPAYLAPGEGRDITAMAPGPNRSLGITLLNLPPRTYQKPLALSTHQKIAKVLRRSTLLRLDYAGRALNHSHNAGLNSAIVTSLWILIDGTTTVLLYWALHMSVD